tara:strand:+ start:23634 stop:24122 length:489 start_codon:yes stop_codon:yes gene_type:complete
MTGSLMCSGYDPEREDGFGNFSIEKLSRHLAIWLLLRGGQANWSVAAEAFSTSCQDLVAAIDHRRSLIVSGDTIYFCGNRDSAKQAIAEHEILALIEHIVIAKSRVVSIAEISEFSGEPSSRVRWAIANYSVWSRRYRPGSHFDLGRCFSDWPRPGEQGGQK